MLELFVAVAGQVIAEALTASSGRVREWLKRDPATLAYQKALARTYTAFARQYPDLSRSLFDEQLLKNRAAPELAKMLTRHQHSDPAALTDLWLDSLGAHMQITPEKREAYVRATSEFLRLLEAELKAEDYFRPVFDSRNFEQIESKLTQVVTELEHQRVKAFAAAQGEETRVQRFGGVDLQAGEVHVARDLVGGDVHYNVVQLTNNLLSDSFTSLKDYYVEPRDVFERVRVQEFVGREWLEAEVERFIHDPNRTSGALVLIGEAGVGKTSFAAHLVWKYRYPHLFADDVGGDVKLPLAIRSLAAQLISRYQIEPFASRDSLPKEPSQFDTFLSRILRLAADMRSAGEKIVIVCDALDQAGTSPGGNVFGLPKQLPDGVYLILTRRPSPSPSLTLEPVPLALTLNARSEENLNDVRAFLEAKAHSPAIADQLRARGYSSTQFVETLTRKSEGLWIYLKYVVDEIARSLRYPLNLEELPTGLSDYYFQHWRDWREGRNGRGEGRSAWNRTYLPLLCALAAAEEPVTAARLAEWVGIDILETEYLTEQWRSFLRQDDVVGERHYSLYHVSLKDFLTGLTDLGAALPEKQDLARDLARGATAAHGRIVEYYRTYSNGDWVKLVEDDYARRHLVTHFVSAKHFDEMFNLVAMSNLWAEARCNKEEGYVGYQNDLNQAWSWAESEAAWNLARQIRCALIQSSIFSFAGNTPPELFGSLVQSGQWSTARVLAQVPQIPDYWQRARTLGVISSYLPESLLSESLDIARSIKDEPALAYTLSALAPYLPEELRAEALLLASDLKDPFARAKALGRIAHFLPEPLKGEVLNEAIAAARKIWVHRSRAEVLSQLALELTEPLKSEVLNEVFASVEKVEGISNRVEVLSRLALDLMEPLKSEVLNEAFNLAVAIESESNRAQALSKLVPYLSDQLKPKVLFIIRKMQDERDVALVLVGVAPHLHGNSLSEALTIVEGIKDENSRSYALRAYAASLSNEMKETALVNARAIHDPIALAYSLQQLIPYLSEPTQGQVFLEALAAVRSIEYEPSRSDALIRLASYLPEKLQGKALGIAREIRSVSAREEALRGLAASLPETIKNDVLKEAFAVTREIHDEAACAYALGELALHLPEPVKGEVVHTALTAVHGIQDDFDRHMALSEIAPQLPSDLISDAFRIASEMTDEYHHNYVFLRLVPHLSDELKAEALAPGGIWSESARPKAPIRASTTFERARTFEYLVSNPPDTTRDVKLQEEFQRVLEDESPSYDPGKRAEKLAEVIRIWQGIQFAGFGDPHRVLTVGLHILARNVRQEFLYDLGALAPLMHHFGRVTTISEVYYAIRDVTTWWR